MAKTPRPRKAAAQAPEPQPAAIVADTPAVAALSPPVAIVGVDLAQPGSDRLALTIHGAGIDLVGANVELWDLDDLYPYDRNTRLHSTEQLDALEAAMRKYGWTIPLLVRPEGGIIAGHARWQVATDRLRLTQGPVIVARGWTEEMIRAYVIWDNRSAEMATWDLPLLTLELGELRSAGFDLNLAGYTLDEFRVMEGAAAARARDPDEDAPAPPADPVTVMGDVWLLGEHRIICGDSTDAATVAQLLAGAKPHLMVTDPPYGVEYDATFRNGIRRANGTIVSARATGKVMNDDNADWREAWALFSGDVAYVWHAGIYAPVVAESLAATGFQLRSQIIWSKSNFAIGRGDYHWQHEPCWYAVRKGAKGHFEGDRKQTTVWQIAKPAKSESGHSTQKPVECMARPILNNSKPGDLVYEPFSGSGTTIIAGQMTGRSVLAVELNPAYVDVAVLRWQEFTGQAAVHAESGLTFAEVKLQRQEVADEAAPAPALQGVT